jgi:glycosyltransferase involved in cell wall biosynthesis
MQMPVLEAHSSPQSVTSPDLLQTGHDGSCRNALRVLHVIDVLTLGGTQNLALRLIGTLQGQGIACSLCVLQSSRRTDARHELPVDPVYLNFEGDYRKPLALRRCVRQLQNLIREVQPDVVHSYLWTSDVVSAWASRRAGVPHLSHLVDRREWQASRKWIHRVRREMTRRAVRAAGTRFLAVSHATRDYACEHMRYPPERVAVAHNAIDVHQFVPRHRDSSREAHRGPLVVGIASRIEPEKGHRDLLAAVGILVGQSIPVHLLVTGDGSARPALEAQVRDLRIADYVEFVGWVDDVRGFYQKLDVFAVPSVDSEGLPTTILEAMASGCVVVATDVGGAREAIRDGRDGYIVPARDPAALARALTDVAHNPHRAVTIATAAAERVREEFSMERMTETVMSAYAALRELAHSR